MSTSIQKEVINVKAIETINKTVFTIRRLLKTNPEQDYNIVSGDVDNDIKRDDEIILKIYKFRLRNFPVSTYTNC